MNDSNDRISKLNKKFNNVMFKLEHYNGTDPESVVQQAYNKYFQAYFGLDASEITRVEKCDSYFTKDKLTALIEYKFNVDFSDSLTRAKVIAQTLIYYKKIIDGGKNEIPIIVFIGDVNECFCFKTKHFSKLMALEGVDYGIAASSAGNQAKLVKAIADDADLQHDIFIINPQKDPMSYICEKMAAMSFDKDARIPITLKNVTRVFEAFSTKICADKKYDSNEMVGLFIDAIRYPEKRIIGGGYLVVPPYKPMKVDMMKTIGMFKFFDKPSDNEAKELTQIYDQLVKDDDRRIHGFFSTPQIWSDLGHKYVADYFKKTGFIEDDNWEGSDKIVCWDCCAGTKSLTRSYRFKNLYVSTLEQSELNASADLSPEAKETFVFDFLNDPISKLPESLRIELQNLRHTDKKLCLFVNPPYGQGQNLGGKDTKGKGNITSTKIQSDMDAAGLKYAGRELFVQFMFKMIDLAREFKFKKDQLVIATFSKPTFMTGDASAKFRSWLLERMTFDSAFLFNASEFAGCSDAWGVSFSIWHNSKSNVNEFVHNIYKNDNGETIKIGQHCFYNTDGKTKMDDWVREGLNKKTHKVVCFKGIFTPVKSTNRVCKSKPCFGLTDDAFGYINSFSTIMHNSVTNIYCAPNVMPGCSISPVNVDRCVQVMSARTLIAANWINDKDVYLKPNTSMSIYDEWVKDCYVNSIDSCIVSLNGIVDGESYNYKNNFFPFSKAETYKLLGQELMKNEVDEKRWCLANGKFDNLSAEGKAVLDAFAACIKASAPFRRDFGQSHPELQLDHWDAGYRQLKQLFSEVCTNEFKQFKVALKVLKTKMQPLVYELGFLRK